MVEDTTTVSVASCFDVCIFLGKRISWWWRDEALDDEMRRAQYRRYWGTGRNEGGIPPPQTIPKIDPKMRSVNQPMDRVDADGFSATGTRYSIIESTYFDFILAVICHIEEVKPEA
jgi:hypothetical protein